MRTLPCEQDIIKILPHISMFLQVNDRSRLMPPIVHKELHSAHARTVRTDGELVKPRFAWVTKSAVVEPGKTLPHLNYRGSDKHMKPYHAEGSRIIKAPPERVYAILTDYRNEHLRILPKPYFMSLQVEKGGVGEGTLINFQMSVLGKTQNFRAAITEPEPGHELDEIYLEPEGVITRFFVRSFGHDKQSQVTIQTEGTIHSKGVLGWFERFFAAMYLEHVFQKELELLAASAEENQ